MDGSDECDGSDVSNKSVMFGMGVMLGGFEYDV